MVRNEISECNFLRVDMKPAKAAPENRITTEGTGMFNEDVVDHWQEGAGILLR